MSEPATLSTFVLETGYDAATIEAIIDALFPRAPERPMPDSQLAQARDGIESVALAGLDGLTVTRAIDTSRRSAAARGADWRQLFWREILRRAARNTPAGALRAA